MQRTQLSGFRAAVKILFDGRREENPTDDERLKYEANSVKSQVQLSVESLR